MAKAERPALERRAPSQGPSKKENDSPLVAIFFFLFGLLWIVGKVSEIVGMVLAFVGMVLAWPYEAMDRWSERRRQAAEAAADVQHRGAAPPKRIGDGGGPDADGPKRPDVR